MWREFQHYLHFADEQRDYAATILETQKRNAAAVANDAIRVIMEPWSPLQQVVDETFLASFSIARSDAPVAMDISTARSVVPAAAAILTPRSKAKPAASISAAAPAASAPCRFTDVRLSQGSLPAAAALPEGEGKGNKSKA